MTTTAATQAILPVTQSDRERAAEIAENLAINSDLFPALIRNGQHDKHPFVQSYARHRQAHSLPGDVGTGKFAIGDRVSKKSGANWNGRVVGFYSTALTPIGYAVESEREIGSVQIYPEAALTPSGEGEA